MKYQLKEFNRNIPDKELLDDINRVASTLGSPKLSSREYDDNGGKFTSGTIGIRFGGWNNALERAGLKLVLKHNASEIELFKNIEDVWIRLGRQPVFRDFKKPLSKFSPQPYRSKFGTFRNALEAFVEFINSDSEQKIENKPEEDNVETTTEREFFKHKTKRYPNERLKVQVLMRDGNKCKLCGVTVTGDNIHFDHIKPWSKVVKPFWRIFRSFVPNIIWPKGI